MGKRNKTYKIWAVALVLALTLTAFAPVPQAAAEETTEEPGATNITFDTARDLKFNTSIAEEKSNSDTKRYYKFSVSEASVLSLGISQGEGSIYIDIYDRTRTSIFHTDTKNWNGVFYARDTSFNNIYLTGGDYYLYIEGNASYSMIASIDSLAESFTETQDVNNNGVNTASAIAFGTNYKGVMAYNDDKDYYKFTLTEPSKVSLNLTNSTNDTLKYTFYDSTVNKSYTDSVGSGKKVEDTITLTPDTYYLAVTKEKDNANGSYSFLLSSVKIVETPKPASTPGAGKSNTSTANSGKKGTSASGAAKAKVPTKLSVKNKASRKAAVRWKAVSGASGYVIEYGIGKKFKNKNTRTILGPKPKCSIVLSPLTKKKTYYVRIRSFVKNSNGLSTFSKWSKAKKVKIRK